MHPTAHDSAPWLQRLTLATGLITLGYAVFLFTLFPTQADGMMDGWWTPILAFEFARTSSDLAFLTGPEAAGRRAAMDVGHHYDMLFPVLYSGLLMLAALRHRPALQTGRLALAALLIATVAIPADIWENTLLLQITGLLDVGHEATDPLQWLPTATWLKWGAIGLSAGLLSILERPTHRGLGLICALCAGVSLLAFTTRAPVLCESMALLVTAVFLGLLTRAFWEVRRRVG